MASTLGWVASLDIDMAPVAHRKTSIICTIGPKTSSVDSLTALRRAGMNIARLNFSHGNHAYHLGVVNNLRASVDSEPLGGKPVAIALDTKGPEIRTGDVKDPEGILIPAGHVFMLTTDEQRKSDGDLTAVYVDYGNIVRIVKPGNRVYIDDGNLSLEVLECGDTFITVRAINEHRLLSHKGVNLPYASVDLPALSDKDREDLRFAVEHDLDMVFASFIRKASDIHAIRDVLGSAGGETAIIAKIENHEGVRNFDEILAAADGIMVARGDLGIEIPPEKVFIAQKMMIARCNMAGKPVICATQMLESMTFNPRPTRAEASDVANAVLDGADCVMLSGETANGAYPAEAVEIMHKICVEAESTIAYAPLFEELRLLANGTQMVGETIACSAVNASLETYIHAIIVLTTTGDTARLIAKFRPQVPIITVTRTERVARQIHLHRGCYPMVYAGPADENAAWQVDVDRRFDWAMEQGKKMGLLKTGDHVVAIQGSQGGVGHTNLMKIVVVP